MSRDNSTPRSVYSIYLSSKAVRDLDSLASTMHRASRSSLVELAVLEFLERQDLSVLVKRKPGGPGAAARS